MDSAGADFFPLYPELPFIIGKSLHQRYRGAGTVFFAGCNMHCVYCQNYEISVQRQGTEISIPHLRSLYEN